MASLTSALGIGDRYGGRLLGAIAEAGGGSLHDPAGGSEVAEVEPRQLAPGGRAALLARSRCASRFPDVRADGSAPRLRDRAGARSHGG